MGNSSSPKQPIEWKTCSICTAEVPKKLYFSGVCKKCKDEIISKHQKEIIIKEVGQKPVIFGCQRGSIFPGTNICNSCANGIVERKWTEYIPKKDGGETTNTNGQIEGNKETANDQIEGK